MKSPIDLPLLKRGTLTEDILMAISIPNKVN